MALLNSWIIFKLYKGTRIILLVVASIRDEILLHTGASKYEIPFIAELIKVRNEEIAWEPAIEKILHNFALRLVVPEKYYKQVNEYVNRTNLKGRIVYQRYQDISQLNSFSSLKQFPSNALFNKLEFNSKSTYITGIEDVIRYQFDYACVNSLEEFNRYNEKAVTQQGLIKSTKGKHEKDDRQNITHRDNFILGWDNQEKISLLKKRFNALQEDQTNNKAKIDRTNEKIEQLKQHQANCNKLIDKYEQFDDIYWQNDAKQIEELKRQLEILKQANDRIAALQQQLVDVETKLSTLRDTSINDSQREIFTVENRIKEISSQIEKEKQSLSSSITLDTAPFVEAYPTYSQIDFENIGTKKLKC
jgi:uncharacterized protein YPO0396